MINLLPPEKRRELHAARQNNLLVRYVFATLITLILVVLIHVGTFALLKSTEISGKNASRENQDKVAAHKKTERVAKEYAANLATAKQIFSKRVPYTDAVINLAAQLPEGIVLDTISLDEGVVGKKDILSARAKSYESALALKDMFNASTIAKDVSIISIGREDASSGESATDAIGSNADYPFSVTMNITFTDELLRPKESNREK